MTVHTEVDVATSTGVQPKSGVACWAFLGFEFADILVEASFMGDVPA